MKIFNTPTLFKAAAALFITVSSIAESRAQLHPLSGIYYQNQYLANPAMAGLEEGVLRLNLGYRQQWSSMPGAPTTQALTGDYGFGNKVGLGLNLYNDKAGLLTRTRVMGTYAYHLPLNGENEKLNFGISLGFMTERLADEDVNGNPGDISIGRVNERETFVDGDFGAAYTSNKLTIQGAIPNMKNFFKKDDNDNVVDQSTFFTAVSYKFYFPQSLNGMGVEPKAAFRGVKGYDDILDIGANLTFANEALSLMGVYHSSQSATFGAGVNYKKTLSIMGMYTTETAALSGYTSGNFELALRVNLF